jgi:hypothetical protein
MCNCIQQPAGLLKKELEALKFAFDVTENSSAFTEG